jgi:hypothetical protein
MRARAIVGVVLLLLGVVWFGQGVGIIGGSFMSGSAFWAVVGAFLVVVGLRFVTAGRATR